MRVHDETVSCVRMTGSGSQRMLTASWDATVKLWGIAEGRGGWAATNTGNSKIHDGNSICRARESGLAMIVFVFIKVGTGDSRGTVHSRSVSWAQAFPDLNVDLVKGFCSSCHTCFLGRC